MGWSLRRAFSAADRSQISSATWRQESPMAERLSSRAWKRARLSKSKICTSVTSHRLGPGFPRLAWAATTPPPAQPGTRSGYSVDGCRTFPPSAAPSCLGWPSPPRRWDGVPRASVPRHGWASPGLAGRVTTSATSSSSCRERASGVAFGVSLGPRERRGRHPRARRSRATIIEGPFDTPCGDRRSVVRDRSATSSRSRDNPWRGRTVP